VYGPDHHQVASTLGNLGIVQQELGRLEDALATQQRALAIKEHVYGPDHHQVASTLGNLGIVQRELGRAVDAEVSFRRELSICQDHLPEDHPHTRRARLRLAQLVAARGEVLLNIPNDDHLLPTDRDDREIDA
jgi:Tfp pilus assembly protein PilF